MNKETVQVVILEGGKTCREVNPYEDPDLNGLGRGSRKHPGLYIDAKNKWALAESKLRTFEIDFTHLVEPLTKLIEAAGGTVDSVSHYCDREVALYAATQQRLNLMML